jgi:hypothetical protein
MPVWLIIALSIVGGLVLILLIAGVLPILLRGPGQTRMEASNTFRELVKMQREQRERDRGER